MAIPVDPELYPEGAAVQLKGSVTGARGCGGPAGREGLVVRNRPGRAAAVVEVHGRTLDVEHADLQATAAPLPVPPFPTETLEKLESLPRNRIVLIRTAVDESVVNDAAPSLSPSTRRVALTPRGGSSSTS